MEHRIKRTINSIYEMEGFDEGAGSGSSCLYIMKEHGRYGIMTDTAELFLSFEYDNITALDFGLWLLAKKGRMGLLHLGKRKETGELYTVRLIPCKYDHISAPYREGPVLLHRYSEGKPAVWAYLPKPGIVTEKYYSVGTTQVGDRIFVYMNRAGKDVLIDADTGKTLAESEDYFTIGVWKGKDGFVVQQFDDEESRLLYITDDESKEINFSGYDICDITSMDTDGWGESTVGFAIDIGEGIALFDGECERLTKNVYDNISVRSVVIGVSEGGSTDVIPLQEKLLYSMKSLGYFEI